MSGPGGTAPRGCPICAGALDADGLCPSCVDGTWDERPALSLDGTLAVPGRRPPPPPPPEPPSPDRTPPAVKPAPDPGHGVPLELDLRPPPPREERLELDESALAAAQRRGASVVVPTAPVQHEPSRPRRRWPWVVLAVVVLGVAATTGVGLAAHRAADDLLRQLIAQLPGLLPGEDARSKAPESALEPGLAGAVLMIDSTPSGAEVYLGDELLGVTPLAVDNPYDDGERFSVTLKKAGYQPAIVGARGGGPAHLQVKLERRR